MEFEWDIEKNRKNQRKHKISFEDAATIFRYPTYKVDRTKIYQEKKGSSISNVGS